VCPRSELCVTREIWSELEGAISTVLVSTTLQKLIERQEKKERAIGLDMGEASKGEPDGEPDQ
jgi:DNA-binding IscR family transcriptional regulator